MDFFKLEVTGKIVEFNLTKAEKYDSRNNGFILYTDNMELLKDIKLETNIKKLTISYKNDLQVARGIKIQEIDVATGKIVIVHNVMMR